MNKKELIEAFLNNKQVDRIPNAFWYHFVSFHNHYTALEDESVYETIVKGQKQYYDEVKPDLVKIMSDGFFGHPSVSKKLIKTIDDIKEISSVSEQDPWIKVQIEYVKDICDYIGDEVYKYYTVFSPLQYIRLRFEEYDEDFEKFVRLFKQDPKAMYNAAKNIAKDIKNLLKKLFEETKVDGIYYSVQTVQDPYFDEDKHKLYVQPLDLMIMEEILKYTDNIILHICGYGNYTNNLKWYVDYPAKVFNWATHTEGISLAQGKEIFNGKAVLGGFDNNPGSILYNADQFALEKEINNFWMPACFISSINWR